MTVGELIEELKKQNPDGEVQIESCGMEYAVQGVCSQRIDPDTKEPYTLLDMVG